jgi:[protein-PII] uridylyltransferase
VSVAAGIRDRRAAYHDGAIGADAVRVVIVPDEAAGATLVEVYAPDAIGLLAGLARVFVDADLDVTTVRAATTGERAVDVFYVRDDEAGGPWRSPSRVSALERALRDAVGRD